MPFLLFSPMTILMAAAVVPAVWLLRYIYKTDGVEKEPPGLIISLVLMGIISTIAASLTERLGMNLLGNIFSTDNLAYELLLNFVVIGLSEEGFKYLLLKKRSFFDPNFNCQYDGVIYAVSVSLGFALWENIQYVFSYGLGTALLRTVTAIPGHASFGVLMGAWYGMSKKYYNCGDNAKYKKYCMNAVLWPVVAHGAYDFCAGLSSTIGSIIFTIFICALFVFCRSLVKVLSENDTYIE